MEIFTKKLQFQRYQIGTIVGIYTITGFIGGRYMYYAVRCNLCGELSNVKAYRLVLNKGCNHCKVTDKRKYSPEDTVNGHTIIKYTRGKRAPYLTRCNRCGEVGYISLWRMEKGNYCGYCFNKVIVEGRTSSSHYLYSTWNQILERCLNQNDKSYHKYGGKGVGAHQDWIVGKLGKSGFECFVFDVHSSLGLRPNMNSNKAGDYINGYGPRSYHLGRIDHDKNYETGNVRWETIEESSHESAIRNKFGHKQSKTKQETYKYFNSKEEADKWASLGWTMEAIKELEASGPWLKMPAWEIDQLNHSYPAESLNDHACFGV